MRPGSPESLAARHVPGVGEPEVHRLGAGLVNETYRVLRDGRAYAMRLTVSNSDDLGLDGAWEARVLERAAAADLAPATEYCDPQRGILISHWADGQSWTAADARRPSNIAKMAEFLRRIHALAMPTPARSMSPAKWIDHYGAAAGRSYVAVAAPNAAGPLRSAATLRSAAERRLAALAALPGVQSVLCHSDLHTLNLIDRGDSLVLLDWEYVHASDPLWDLAGWGANNDFEDELMHELLASYTGRRPNDHEYSRLQLLIWLYDYVCLCWSELYLILQHAGRPGVAAQGDASEGVAARALGLAARLDASS